MHTLTGVPGSTQLSIRRGMVNEYSGLNNNSKWRWWTRTYSQVRWFGLRAAGNLALSLHSSDECHITFFPTKNPVCDAAFRQNVWPLVVSRFFCLALRHSSAVQNAMLLYAFCLSVCHQSTGGVFDDL